MVHPMLLRHSAILFLCVINFDILRNLKESLLLPRLGAEAIPFVKLWVVMPAALFFLVTYSFLANRLSKRLLFIISLLPFLLWMPLFSHLLYPNLDHLAPARLCQFLTGSLPDNLQLVSHLVYYWPLTLLLAVAELWSSAVLCILFWTTVNDVYSPESATHNYPLITLLGNSASILSGLMIIFYAQWNRQSNDWQDNLWMLTLVYLACGLGIIFLYEHCRNRRPSVKAESGFRQTATQLSLQESFSYLFKCPYLACITVMMVAYCIAANTIDVAWKSQLVRLYPTEAAYSAFIGKLTFLNGIGCVLFALLGSLLLKRSWQTAAMTTPILMGVTAVPFFLLAAGQTLELAGSTLGLLNTGVIFGMCNSVVSRSGKYTLFDSTKEMAFVPLNNEQKFKGKAAIELIASKLGKSSSALLQQVMITFCGSLTLAMPWLAALYMLATMLWLVALNSLGKRYSTLIDTTRAG
ncbi:MAG: Npt1/Npt2 family nucleotide transporter [Endozoicomonas sp.]